MIILFIISNLINFSYADDEVYIPLPSLKGLKSSCKVLKNITTLCTEGQWPTLGKEFLKTAASGIDVTHECIKSTIDFAKPYSQSIKFGSNYLKWWSGESTADKLRPLLGISSNVSAFFGFPTAASLADSAAMSTVSFMNAAKFFQRKNLYDKINLGLSAIGNTGSAVCAASKAMGSEDPNLKTIENLAIAMQVTGTFLAQAPKVKKAYLAQLPKLQNAYYQPVKAKPWVKKDQAPDPNVFQIANSDFEGKNDSTYINCEYKNKTFWAQSIAKDSSGAQVPSYFKATGRWTTLEQENKNDPTKSVFTLKDRRKEIIDACKISILLAEDQLDLSSNQKKRKSLKMIDAKEIKIQAQGSSYTEKHSIAFPVEKNLTDSLIEVQN